MDLGTLILGVYWPSTETQGGISTGLCYICVKDLYGAVEKTLPDVGQPFKEYKSVYEVKIREGEKIVAVGVSVNNDLPFNMNFVMYDKNY